MNFVSFNFSWIFFNVFLAVVPVIFTLILEGKLNKFARISILFLWFIFLPNTIYLITDIQYLPIQFLKAELYEKSVLLLQYGVVIFLGFFTYFYSLKPIENFIAKNAVLKTNKIVIFTSINLIIAFAVTLGKFTRIHSWFIFTKPQLVINSFFEVLFTPLFLLYFLLFGIFLNLVYFYTNGYLKKNRRKK